MNVLIVDDEPIVRLGLSTLIEWDRHGFRLAGTAQDGVDALQRIQEEPVDIVVTDILMPRMDGLELVRRLRDGAADLAVVILSCMDDFAYVKEAMKLGARDYVLKPTMEPEGLLAILFEAKLSLEKEREQREQLLRWQQELEQSKPAQLGARLEKWLATGAEDDGLEQKLLPAGKWLYSMGVHAVPGALLHAQWELPGLHAVIRCGEGSAVLLFAEALRVSRQEMNRVLQETSFRLQQWMVQDAGQDSGQYLIGVGRSVGTLQDVEAACRLLERQVRHRFYAGGELLIIGESSSAPEPPSSRMPQDEKVDLLKAVSTGNLAAALDAAERIELFLKTCQPPLDKVYPFVHELLGAAAGYARGSGRTRMDDFEAEFIRTDKIRSFLQLEGLCHFLREAVYALAGSTGDGPGATEPKNPFIRKAVQFMQEHFRENIGTTDIADYVRLSRSYLSDLYSKEMGEPLSESLTRIRLEEAKRLLRTGEKKVYEVAEAVGFQDAKTFAKTFKKVVGCSPKEYESLHTP